MRLIASALGALSTISPRRPTQVRGVALVLAVLEVGVLWSWLVGFTVPNGDFMAHYLTDGYLWWERAGLFRAPDWFDYAWMGRPGTSNLQSSQFYLPVAAATLVHPYAPYVAALVAAATSGFGALGAYLLVWRWRPHHPAALLAMVGQFFNPVIFSNAQHQDIARGAALLPWVFLVLSPLWPWRYRWAIPVGAVVLWQYLIAAYPGQLVMTGYCLVAWAAGWIAAQRTGATWVWRSAITGALAVVLSLAKFVPALAVGTGSRGAEGQRVHLALANAATVFYPYDDAKMLSDISMRPYFVVAPLLLLAVLGVVGRRTALPALATFGVATGLTVVAAALPGVLSHLPGMSLSRVWLNDIRALVAFTIILIGALAYAELATTGSPRTQRQRDVTLFVVVVAAVLVAGTLNWSNPLPTAIRVLIPLGLVVASALVVRRLATPAQRAAAPSTLVMILALAMSSGAFFAYSVTSPWASPRTRLESVYYGKPISELIVSADCAKHLQQRPARNVPDIPPADYWHDIDSLSAAFTCESSISGYTNIPGNPVLREQQAAFTSADGAAYRRFFAAPGGVFPAPAGDDPALLAEECLTDGSCGSLDVTPVAYERSGQLVYEVATPQPTRVILNESWYPGWQVSWCEASGGCRPLTSSASPASAVVVDLPAGSATLTLTYKAPYAAAVPWLLLGALTVTAGTAALPPGRRGRGSACAPADSDIQGWEAPRSV